MLGPTDVRALVSLLVLLSLASCGARAPVPDEARAVTTTLREEGWLPENRARLERLVDALAARSGRRVAVLDWDNTMMRGDIGDLVLAHLIERGEVLRAPPGDDPMLTPAAHRAIAGAPGEGELAQLIAHVAWRGRTPAGEPAFTIPVSRFHRASYALIAQVIAAGRTDDELRAIAREAWARAIEAEVGTIERVGGVELERFARLHHPMIELARALEGAGVEVWIVSASSQPIVEAMAEIAGLSPARVIGVRSVHDAEGRGTAAFEACGEGPLETPVITWLEGKRCWINRVIFDLPASRLRERQEDPALRPVFAAGDSDGDLAMLQDATELALALDRHQPRLMCHALADPVRWLVQPLFVAPPPPRDEPYPCSTIDDALGPIVDARGARIADQRSR